MEELMKTTWPEEDLVRELLDDESPLFMVMPQEISESNSNIPSNESSLIGQLMSDSSMTNNYRNNPEDFLLARSTSMLERGLCKGESKYTLRIKSSGNVMADDGYKWRKYGQKSIKNSSNPRSYYRCTNPRCSAKKQVERSTDDPDTLVITYEGLHLHFIYPFFSSQTDDSTSLSKKPRKSILVAQAHDHNQQIQEEQQPGLAQKEVGSQGLLEDMVPMIIRNPQINNTSTCSHSSSTSSCPSPPISSPSFSWSPPDYYPLCFDIGI